jgi:trimeric autotransporter adhesin
MMNVFKLLLTLAASVAIHTNVRAEFQPCSLATGLHTNDDSAPQLAFSGVLSATNAARLRVHFFNYHLGLGSYVQLQSVQDGEVQILNASGMTNWSATSGIFNGSTLRIQLYVAPGDRDVFFIVDGFFAESGREAVKDPYSQHSTMKTLCGGDNRVPSNDNRVGRLNVSGCTGWLVSNGAVLTAGHCAPVGSVFEVNIPPSAANGTTVASAIQDQFPVVATGQQSQSSGAGADWAVFSLGPNSLGEIAHVKFGFFRLTRSRPAVGTTLRVTGCGVDNTPAFTGGICGARDSAGACTHPNCNAQSQTLQTGTGTFSSETITAGNATLTYAVDTEPANSGSPIIWEANGWAIGIHDAGGCTAGGGANGGTSFEHDPLESALNAAFGLNTVHLDTIIGPNNPAPDGSIVQPYHDFAAAQLIVPAGGRISIVTGNYSVPAGTTYSKAMTVVAPVGPVTIGP